MDLHTSRFPSSCEPAVITGSGLQDREYKCFARRAYLLNRGTVILATDYGESSEFIDHFGGRVSWLENYGTDEGDWVSRSIGRFPGINQIKGGIIGSCENTIN